MIPARDFASASEILAARAALRKRLFSPRTATQKTAEPKEQTVTPIVMFEVDAAPTPPACLGAGVTLDTPNLKPKHFIKLKCMEYEFDHALMISAKHRTREQVRQRDRLISEVRRRYPHLSLARIGAEFGGMDHSSVHSSLQRSGIPVEKRIKPEVPRDRIIALLNAGHPQHKIVEMVCCSKGSVSLIAKSLGKCKQVNRLSAKEDEIKALYNAGWSHADIATELEFSASAVGRFVKMRGWKR